MEFPFGSHKSIDVSPTGTLYHQTCSIKHVLGILRNDAENIFAHNCKDTKDVLQRTLGDEKIQLVEKILEKITVGEGEISILSTLARYLELLDLERYRYALQVKRLSDENQWLKDENEVYGKYKNNLVKALTEANDQKEYYKYIYHNRNLDAQDVPLFKGAAEQIMDDAGWCNIDVHDLENADKVIPSQLRAVYKLIMQNINSNNFTLCHKLLNEIIKRTEKSTGPVSADIAYLHDIKALVYRKEKRLNETNKHLQLACEIREKLFGKVSLQVATTMNNISICSSKLGNFTEAEKACRVALDIRKKVCGPFHPQVIKQLHNLGLICTFLGRFDEALHLFEEALKALSTSDDQDVLDNLRVQSSIAMCHLKSNNLDKAEKVMITICRDYHMHIKGHKSDPLIDPDIWMIIANNNMKPLRAVEILVDEFDVISRHDILYVIAKNLYTYFGKQGQSVKQKIVQDWLNLKPGEHPRKKVTIEKYESKYDLSGTDDKSMKSYSEQSKAGSARGGRASSEDTSGASGAFRAMSQSKKDMSSKKKSGVRSMFSKKKKDK